VRNRCPDATLQLAGAAGRLRETSVMSIVKIFRSLRDVAAPVMFFLLATFVFVDDIL
jgi:hypothetical protein